MSEWERENRVWYGVKKRELEGSGDVRRRRSVRKRKAGLGLDRGGPASILYSQLIGLVWCIGGFKGEK